MRYIDWELFGMYARLTRLRLGFRRVDDWCMALEDSTGVHISPCSYYKIERGEMEPSAERFFAIISMCDERTKKKIASTCIPDAGISKLVGGYV